jgi:hypothetical protein
MRLVHRDKGCVVCHAMGTDSIYQYYDDSHFFEGSHIFPFTMQSLVCFYLFAILIVNTVTHYSFKVVYLWICEAY